MSDVPSKPVTDQELLDAYAIPAVNANKMIAANMINGMRIAFAEAQLPAIPPQYRAAILLSYEDAAALAQLIERQLAAMRDRNKPGGYFGTDSVN